MAALALREQTEREREREGTTYTIRATQLKGQGGHLAFARGLM